MSKIIKSILFFFVLSIYTQALAHENIVDIDANFSSTSSPDYIYYINDKNRTLSPSEVLHSKALKQATKVHLGTAKGPFWTRVTLKNSSESIQNLSLFNPLAGNNSVDIYIYKSDKLITSHTLGDMREQSKREVVTRYSMFNLSLLAGESVTIVSKIENLLIYNIGLYIEKPEFFMERENHIIFGLAFFGGLTIVFSIFTFLLFKIYKQKEYLILSFYFIAITLYTYSFNGVFYQLNMGINLKFISTLPWASSLFIYILATLFASFFFNFKESYPKLAIFTNILVSLASINLLLVVYSLYTNQNIPYIFNLHQQLGLVTTLSFPIIGIYMFVKNEIGAKYYLIGHVSYLLAVLINLAGLFGIITYYEGFKILLPTAVMVDALFLLVAQYVKTNKRQLDLYKNKELLLEQSRFVSIGQAIGNITHQWKQPLANFGSSVTYLEAVLKNDTKDLENAFHKKLPNLLRNITQMQHTIDDFSSYYSTANHVENFNPKMVLNKYVFEILNSKIILKNVDIKLEIDNALQIHCYEHIFSNIMMILIDNSLDTFQSSYLGNQIIISISEHNNHYEINYIDNAGGIKIDPIETVFKYFVSSKEDSDSKSHGMGLAIAKMLVEDRLNGKISVKNRDDGALFQIIFPV